MPTHGFFVGLGVVVAAAIFVVEARRGQTDERMPPHRAPRNTDGSSYGIALDAQNAERLGAQPGVHLHPSFVYGIFRFLVEYVRGNEVAWEGLTRPQIFCY